MSAEQNKAQVRRFFEEAFSQGNVAVVDEIFAPGCVYHLNSDVVIESADRAKAAIVSVRTMNPDLYYTVEEQIAEGNFVAARLSYGGAYQGGSETFPETAKGKRFAARGLFMVYMVEGKFVEAWHSTDRLSHFQQLDLTLVPVAPQ